MMVNRSNNTRITLAILGQKMDYVTQRLDEHIKENKQFKKELPDQLQKQFSAKWVEKVMAGGIVLILLTTLGAVIGMVIN